MAFRRSWPLWVALAGTRWAGGAEVATPLDQLVQATPDEPVAAELSLPLAARAMDDAALRWQNAHGCCQCHANLLHLVARPALAPLVQPTADVRAFFERLVADRWERHGLRYREIKVPPGDPPVGTEAVVVAVPLALHDARTTGRLHPLTRRALDRMLALQRADGGWNVVTDLPRDGFSEFTQAMLAAVGIAAAPDGYADTAPAQKALERIRGFTATHPPQSRFHRGWLLWAAAHVAGLADERQQAAALEGLLGLQRDDGGWCYAELLLDDQQRRTGAFAATRPSDAYGTGFVVFAARQAGVPAADPRLQRGIAWLRANQRSSGRWFNQSLVGRKFNVLSNAATCWAVLALEACGQTPPAARPSLPQGDAVIRSRAGPTDIVITTTSRLAGAIHSLTWNGREFIDSTDHGRQLQSAANFDCGRDFVPEVFNPTEAGSRRDHVGPTSTSRLWRLAAAERELESQCQMAFWLAPGETSLGQAARNDRLLSEHLLAKRVRIGCPDLPHAIQYDVTFTVPPGQRHTFAQFEAVTGYMPPEFEKFWRLSADRKALLPLDDGPGEQSDPVVFALPSGTHALGVYSPDQPSAGFEGAGYGRFRFATERVVKWNCVFRVRDAAGIRSGEYAFRTFLAVGTLEDVRATLAALAAGPP